MWSIRSWLKKCQHDWQEITTWQVRLQHDRWDHNMMGEITTWWVRSQHDRWHHNMTGDITTWQVTSQHDRWHHNMMGEITTWVTSQHDRWHHNMTSEITTWQVTSQHGQWDHNMMNLLVYFQGVLQAFLHDSMALQLVAVYSLQVHCHQNSFPKGKAILMDLGRWREGVRVAVYLLQVHCHQNSFPKGKAILMDLGRRGGQGGSLPSTGALPPEQLP